MKLLCDHILKEYGFIEDRLNSTIQVTIYCRDHFEIIFKKGQYFYAKTSGDSPVRDLSELKKLYKENKQADLTPIY